MIDDSLVPTKSSAMNGNRTPRHNPKLGKSSYPHFKVLPQFVSIYAGLYLM